MRRNINLAEGSEMNQDDLDDIIQMHYLRLLGMGGARASLSDADLSGLDLSGASLRAADFSGADLSGAYLLDVDFSGAYLLDVDFSGAYLYDANLSDADLSGADFSSANLRNADFSNADLRDANFSDARLHGADFSGSIGGPPYYSIAWCGHGEQGRRLHAVEQNGELVFSCGCWSGSEGNLLEYIEQGPKHYVESRLRALDIILELHKAGK